MTDYNKRGMYVQGSAAPQFEPIEQPIRRERHPEHVNPARRRNARKNQQKARQMSPVYVLFLSIVTVATAMALVSFVQLKSQVATQKDNITTLQSEIVDLKADNDAELNTILSAVNLTTIRDRATTELEMMYPTENQVVYYTLDKNDYMEQYDEVPEEEHESLVESFFH